MKPLDYVLIAAVAVVIGLAIYFTVKRLKSGKGSCGCNCSSCSGCAKNDKCGEKKKTKSNNNQK